MKRFFLALALVASLSACASFEVRPPTEASIAKAADRAASIENGYAVVAEMTAFSVGAFDAAIRAKLGDGDCLAFGALIAGRSTYPAATAMAPSDTVRVTVAIERSDAAHASLQRALGSSPSICTS